MHSDRNSGIFLTSIGTKVQTKIVLQLSRGGIILSTHFHSVHEDVNEDIC